MWSRKTSSRSPLRVGKVYSEEWIERMEELLLGDAGRIGRG
jgi:hypothetical protein